MDRCDDFDQEQICAWDEMSRGFGGEAPFLNHISHPELAHLIGWATHVQGPSEPEPSLRNPLIGLPNDPLPWSIHRYLEELAVEVLQKQEAGQQLLDFQSQVKASSAITSLPWEAFDGSAMDAISIVLQEMITATLLPFARLHVQRCRQVEQTQEHGVSAEEWTLLPEDAILALVKESGGCLRSPGLATASPPHKVTSSLAAPNFEPGAAALDREKALGTWCSTQNLDPIFLQNNKELFQLFLPSSDSDGC